MSHVTRMGPQGALTQIFSALAAEHGSAEFTSTRRGGGATLNITQVYCFAQRVQWVRRRDKFVGNVALEACVGDCAHYSIPLHFLGAIQFVPAGNSAGMEMCDPLNVLTNGLNQITFHDLHVVNVV